MTTEVKNLVFKGLEKKEQILFKSFLNLTKNELSYQVVILKDDSDGTEPDIVIKDSSYQFPDSEQSFANLPVIVVGNDVENTSPGYLSRPVQWSDFKSALVRLDIGQGDEDTPPEERVLPDEMEFVIAEMDEKSETDSVDEAENSYSEAGEYDYELDNMSVDYHSFTNSEYMKVVDDVKGFKEGDEPEPPQAVVLMTDDESGSANSVLVIETNTLDAWEMSESELDDDATAKAINAEPDSEDTVDESAEEELTRKLESGTPVNEGDEYWKYDLEIYSGRDSLFFIKPEREMVYSTKEPAKWSAALAEQDVTKIPISRDWHPTENLKAYPINRLYWAAAIANKTKQLADGMDESTEYILESWPHFEMLELDNVLLKLCTLLFVNPESAYTLMQKSGYSRHVVFGLMNACNDLGLLRKPEEISIEQFSEASNEDGVFGKIKDVFR